ncbi:MAG: GDP-L-fucose synthase [Anaerolineales bacterium]
MHDGALSPTFWRRHRVLITGGGGFLGSYIQERLRRAETGEIIAPRKADFDLIQAGAAERLLQQTKPSLVLHLAAHVGGIGANRSHPGEFFYDNLMMGVQLFHEAWRQGVEKFVAIGTVCSYPKFTPVPFHEDDFWAGYPEETNAPYGLAKKMLLVQAQAYRQQYGFPSIYLVPVNLYGPRDNFDLESSHVIPALIRKCVEAEETGQQTVEVWGDGTPTREFLYAADAADGITLAAERYDGPEPVNLGSGVEISIRDLAELIGRLTGFSGRFVWDLSRPNGQPRRALATDRAEERFGFRAQTALEEGLRGTVAWFRAHRTELDRAPGSS